MSLKLVSLASGSKGNAILIQSENTAVLVDAGISLTRITKELKTVGLTPSMLDGVVITHEHNDHIKGIQRLQNYTRIYAHEMTAKAIYERNGMLKNYQEVEYYENGFKIGDIEVNPFRIPHDAVYPLAYSFECDGKKVSVATDIGRPTVGVFKNICESEIVLLEANHDIEMLKNGTYSKWLKARILGQNGHLSNDSTALIAERLTTTSVKTLVLGHMSENNNLPEIALNTVSGALKKRNSDINVCLAMQHTRSEVFET